MKNYTQKSAVSHHTPRSAKNIGV